jgi:AmmeMemoRadiSam system protein A
MTNSLSTEDGKTLVATARQSITEFFDKRKLHLTSNENLELSVPRGVFVTLLDAAIIGGLRGCIGNPFPKSSLLAETARCAIEAATMDPRFDPVRLDEFQQRIIVEVTVLSPMEHIMVKSPLDLPLNIEVGRDGLLVEGAGGRGLLLPQVAVDEGFDAEEFLNQCCLKGRADARCLGDAWCEGCSVPRADLFRGRVRWKGVREEAERGRT